MSDIDSTTPSQSPIFIKRKKKTSNHITRTKTDPTLDPSTTGHEDDEDQQGSDPTIEEIIALRKLKKHKVGIELEKLNAGELNKKRKKKPNINKTTGNIDDEPSHGLEADDEIRKDDRLDEDEPEDEDARARKIIKANNFTQQTNTLDVDKHMMMYIEEELRNRRKAAIAAGADASSEPILTGLEAVASLDPRDELYKIAEKYRIDKKPVVEGNVTLSATMLTSIPEVDLGIDTRIKNIEATEKAKKILNEQRSQTGPNPSKQFLADSKEHFAADRFLLPNHLKQHSQPDLDSLKIARLEKEGMLEEAEAMRKELKKRAYQLKYGNNNNHQAGSHRHHGPGRSSNQVATDDRAVENFRKRLGGRR